jgi:hypothetical protein
VLELPDEQADLIARRQLPEFGKGLCLRQRIQSLPETQEFALVASSKRHEDNAAKAKFG